MNRFRNATESLSHFVRMSDLRPVRMGTPVRACVQHACACVRVRVHVCACMRVCVRVCVHTHACPPCTQLGPVALQRVALLPHDRERLIDLHLLRREIVVPVPSKRGQPKPMRPLGHSNRITKQWMR